MAGNDIGAWYRNIPQITKYWFTGSVVLPLAGKIGLVTPQSMILNANLLFQKFHIWRPITALFYYPITPGSGFHYLLMLYFMYSYSTRLETGIFSGKPADYLFLLLFNWVSLVVIGLILNVMLLLDPMVMSILYIWCQVNKDTIVQFWFGTQFKAVYFPWILLAFNLIISGGGFTDILGIVVGHLYFFLMFKYPQDFGGLQLIRTPAFLYKYFPNQRGGVSGFGIPPASARRPQEDDAPHGRGYNWGRGNQLGGN